MALGGCFRPGDAVLVNLAPMGDGFSLILSEVELRDCGSDTGAYSTGVQGWMTPDTDLPDFLKDYSLAGGTHHSAMVYGADIKALAAFGRIMGFNVVIIGG